MGGLLKCCLRFVSPRLIKDSRNLPSWAHTLAVPFAILTMLKWLLGGFTISVRALTLTVPPTAASDAVMILGVWLVYLGQREFVEKKYNAGDAAAAQNGSKPQGGIVP